MPKTETLKVTTPSDREVAMSRVFDAPRRLVFEALTKAELIQRWLTGPPGWTMTTCEIEPRVGGAYRYVWRHVDGRQMGMRGVVREIAPPERIVVTEAFDEAWYPGHALVTTTLVEQGGQTTLTMTVRYESKDARDAVLETPMTTGVGTGYDNLAQLLTTLA